MQATKQHHVQVSGTVKRGKLHVKDMLDLPDGDVRVTVEVKPKLKYKGRRIATPEETAREGCPFPDESEWVEALERMHAKKNP